LPSTAVGARLLSFLAQSWCHVNPAHGVASGHSGVAFAKADHGVGVAEDVQGLLETFEVFGADEHCGWPTVARHDDPFVFALDAVGVLRKAVLHRPQRLGRHGYKCATTRTDAATDSPEKRSRTTGTDST